MARARGRSVEGNEVGRLSLAGKVDAVELSEVEWVTGKEDVLAGMGKEV
jgi:hypothetical protein